MDRDLLRERLARRVHNMVDQGLLGEVRRLDAAVSAVAKLRRGPSVMPSS
ncbi:hypothetical protein AHiyo4_17430 [Arthrobacter sp. Hiyo4]|nr:hypothetical protein AHiyo4_17430 [Arthrobacter sp. Hiyo4]